MPLLLKLEEAYEAAKDDPEFSTSSTGFSNIMSAARVRFISRKG